MPLKISDFPDGIKPDLLRELQKIDSETKEIKEKARFCLDHNFRKEANYLKEQADTRTDILVGICNSLGKYF